MKILEYETEEKIYESSNSLVYRAKEKDGKPPVILKILKEDHSSAPKLKQFHQEFKTTVKFQSPNIIKISRLEKINKSLVLIVED